MNILLGFIRASLFAGGFPDFFNKEVTYYNDNQNFQSEKYINPGHIILFKF